MRSLRVFLISLVLLAVVFPATSVSAGLGFMPPNEPVTLENGLVFEFSHPEFRITNDNAVPGYVKGRLELLFLRRSVTMEFTGFELSITNTTKQIMVVKWAESSLYVGRYTGIPGIGGMTFRDLGKPGATPDTILPPGRGVKLTLWIPRPIWNEVDKKYEIKGELIPVDNKMNILLAVKVVDASNNARYYTVEGPRIGE